MFFYNMLEYDEPLFRPPSEADSLILQITHGCAWNKCAFCEMYSGKKFYVKPEEKVLEEIKSVSQMPVEFRKVFLADGNPMCLPASKLLTVLNAIKKDMPKVRRVTTYSLPGNVANKSMDELKQLREAGLTMLYVGIESGDDEVLRMINKSETHASTVEGLLKAKEAGFKLSVIILNGVGGKKYSEQHAIHSAKILNEIQPEYASSLILSFPYGEEHFKQRFAGEYIPMNPFELLQEMETFIAHTELESTIYRSNHASNYMALSGVLGKDKERFLEQLRFAIANPDNASLREEWMRGL